MEDPVCTADESQVVTQPAHNKTCLLVKNCPINQELLNGGNGRVSQQIQCLIDHSSVGSGSNCKDPEKVHNNAATESEVVCIIGPTRSLSQSLSDDHLLAQNDGGSLSVEKNLGISEESMNAEDEETPLQESNCLSVGANLYSGTTVEIDKHSVIQREPIGYDNIENSALMDANFGLSYEPQNVDYAVTSFHQESNCLSVGAALDTGSPEETDKLPFIQSEPVTCDSTEDSLCAVDGLQVIHESSKNETETRPVSKIWPIQVIPLNDECGMVLDQEPCYPVDFVSGSDETHSFGIHPVTNKNVGQSLCTVEKLAMMQQSNQNQESWPMVDCQPITKGPSNGVKEPLNGKIPNADSFSAPDEYCSSPDASHCSDNPEPIDRCFSIKSEPVSKECFEESMCTVEQIQAIYQPNQNWESLPMVDCQPIAEEPLNGQIEKTLGTDALHCGDNLELTMKYSSVESESATYECPDESTCSVEQLQVMYQPNPNQGESWPVNESQHIMDEPLNGNIEQTPIPVSIHPVDECCLSCDASHCSDKLETVDTYSAMESESLTKECSEEPMCTVNDSHIVNEATQIDATLPVNNILPVNKNGSLNQVLPYRLYTSDDDVSQQKMSRDDHTLDSESTDMTSTVVTPRAHIPIDYPGQSHVIPQVVQNDCNVSLECGKTPSQERQYVAQLGNDIDSLGGIDHAFVNGGPMYYEYMDKTKWGMDESQPPKNHEEMWPPGKNHSMNGEYEETPQQNPWPGQHYSGGDKSQHITNPEAVAIDSYKESEQETYRCLTERTRSPSQSQVVHVLTHSGASLPMDGNVPTNKESLNGSSGDMFNQDSNIPIDGYCPNVNATHQSLAAVDTSFIKREPLSSESEEEPMCTENELQENNQPIPNDETGTLDKTVALDKNCLNQGPQNAKNKYVTQQLHCHPSQRVNREGGCVISFTESVPCRYSKTSTGSLDQSLVGQLLNQSGEILPPNKNLAIQKEPEIDKNGERFGEESECFVHHQQVDYLPSSSSTGSIKNVGILSSVKTEPLASWFGSTNEPTCTLDQLEVGHQPTENYAESCPVTIVEHMDTFQQRQRPVDQAAFHEKVSSSNSRTVKDVLMSSSITVEPMSCDSNHTELCDLIHHIKREPLNTEYEETRSTGIKDQNNLHSVGTNKAPDYDGHKEENQWFIKSESGAEPQSTVDQMQAGHELTPKNHETCVKGKRVNSRGTRKQAANRNRKQNTNRRGNQAANRQITQTMNRKAKQNTNTKKVESQDDSWQTSSREHKSYITPNNQADEKPVISPKQAKLSKDPDTPCQFCGKLVQINNIHRHVLIHTNEKAFCCDICGKAFNQKSTLDSHRRVHTGERPFKCSDCGKGFKQRGNLSTHRRRHACTNTKYKCQGRQKPISCGTFEKVFENTSSSEDYHRVHTEKPLPYSQRAHTEGNLFPPSGEAFKELGNLSACSYQREGPVHTNEKTVYCGTRGKVFKQESELEEHQQLHSGDRPFSCGICEKAYKNWGSLKQHERRHARTRRKETVKREYDDLEKLHDEKKPSVPLTRYMAAKLRKKMAETRRIIRKVKKESFMCPTCGKLFASKASLYNHQLTHSGEKPFACSICSKTFTQSGHLKTHEYIHSKIRPFTCYVCKKGFNQKQHMVKHMHKCHPSKLKAELEVYDYLHKKETLARNGPIRITRSMATEFPNDFMETKDSVALNEPVPCPVCNTLLANKASFVKHFSMYGFATRFPCSLCSKTFPSKEKLKAHLQRHKFCHSHICSICGTKFLQGSTLKNHRIMVHGATSATGRRREKSKNSWEESSWEEKPCICSTCKQAFTTLQSFVKHSCTNPV